MIRASIAAALLSLAACSSDSPREAACELSGFDLSTCDLASLSQVELAGHWTLNASTASRSVPGYFSFGLADGGSDLNTYPLTSTSRDGGLFLVSDVVSDGIPVRYVFAGCRAPSSDRLEGEVKFCAGGSARSAATFTAARIRRQAGEAEAQGLTLVSETRLPEGYPADVFVSGTFAYVPAYVWGLFIYDVSNPATPQLAATIKPKANEAFDTAWVQGSTLLVASRLRGLLVYDIGDPRNPVLVRETPQDAVRPDLRSLHVEGNRLVAASPYPNAEVILFDISDPRQPTVLARPFREDSDPNRGEYPLEAFGFQNRLYVSHWLFGLVVYDVSAPAMPSFLGRYAPQTEAPTGSAVAAAFGERLLAFEGGDGWGGHLRTLDVTRPEAIAVAGEFRRRPEVSVSNFVLSGTKLYAAYYQDGVRVLDVGTPERPTERAYFNTWREDDPGRGGSFRDGVLSVRLGADGLIYAAEKPRGLMIFREE